MIGTDQNCLAESSFASGRRYADPFNDVTLDVVFAQPDGEEHRVPAFWSGEATWRVRYASAKIGIHRYRTICSDESNADLHGREGSLEVRPYEGANPLLKRGHLRVAKQVGAAPFDRVTAGLQHVAAVRKCECTACVLLDHHDPDPERVDLDQLVEHRVHRQRREPRRRLVEQQQPRLRDERVVDAYLGAHHEVA